MLSMATCFSSEIQCATATERTVLRCCASMQRWENRLPFGKTREHAHRTINTLMHFECPIAESSTMCHRVIGTIDRCSAIVIVHRSHTSSGIFFFCFLLALKSKSVFLLIPCFCAIVLLFRISFGHFPSLFYAYFIEFISMPFVGIVVGYLFIALFLFFHSFSLSLSAIVASIIFLIRSAYKYAYVQFLCAVSFRFFLVFCFFFLVALIRHI